MCQARRGQSTSLDKMTLPEKSVWLLALSSEPTTADTTDTHRTAPRPRSIHPSPMTTIARRALALGFRLPPRASTRGPASLGVSMYRTGAATHMHAGQVTTDTNLGKTLDDTMHKAERARKDVWFREHDLVNLRELYKKARMQAKHMEGEAVKTDAAELKELELLVEGKLDQATMERLIDWKHHH